MKKERENKIKIFEREIDTLEKKQDNFNMYKKVKKYAGLYKTHKMGRLFDSNDKVIVDKESHT